MKAPKLIAVTRPLEHMTPEEFIAYQARVTSPQNQDNHDTAFKLLKYCLNHGHWSVFSMVDMTVEIHTSRAIMAQILRHYSFDFQEFSQRYSAVDLTDWSYLEARGKADSNRQGSTDRVPEQTAQMKMSCQASEYGYHDLLKNGVAPESARMVLPMAIPTRAYMKGSVRSWITYFWQRSSLHHTHAQKEHRELADEIFDIFQSVFPNIGKIVEEGMSMYLTKEEISLITKIRNNPQLNITV